MESVRALKEEIDRLRAALNRREEETEKLKVSNLFLEALFHGIQEEIMVVDQDFVIQDVNKTFLDSHGIRKQHALGRKCYEVASSSKSSCGFGTASCPLEKTKETGEREEVTHYLQKKEGGLKELLRIMYPVAYKRKTPKYFVEITRDVTEYRDLIRKLQSSEKKFRSILDTATDAILSIDEGHRIILFNNAAQQIFGYSRSEVLGKNLNMLIPPQYGDHYRFVRRFLETKEPRIMGETLNLTGFRKGGEEFPLELGLSYHELEEGVTFTAIIRDVSTQRQLEKKLLQTERLAAVGQTVAHVAHEIKNPLMIIGGFSHQIKKSLTDENSLRKLDMILDEVVRLERLVESLGDFTKVYKLVKRPAHINVVMEDVLRIMGEIYPAEKYGFRAALSSDLEEIHCDPDKLKQVFMNIIANGVEAMEEGGTIAIRTQKRQNGVEIQISDEGIGIGEADLLHIFEPFYTTRKRGSGLGLSISYKIVEAHNGEISAVSKPGKGTTFVIRLPAE